jgi:peptidoglycan/xylan/chitin deacetylase (PgdA/CDA1 family)
MKEKRKIVKKPVKAKIRKIVFFIIYYTGILDLTLFILARKRERWPHIILLYHRIVEKDSMYLNKGPVVQHKISHFENEIKYLRKYYQVVSIDELIHRMQNGLESIKPCISITFDDGYLDNYELAYPILKKYEVPATIYLAASLIGTNERTWTDQIEFAMMETEKENIKLPELFGEETIGLRTRKQKEQANIKIAEALKLIPDESRKELMGKIFQVLDIDKNSMTNGKLRRMLNWEEVQKMARDGITIGSHGHTHSVLSKMPVDKAKEDILTSKKIIEEELGIKVKHFSFPNGREEDFSAELGNYCREIGFESIASAVYGVNDLNGRDALLIKRIGANSPVWMMAGELFREIMRWYLRS